MQCTPFNYLLFWADSPMTKPKMYVTSTFFRRSGWRGFPHGGCGVGKRTKVGGRSWSQASLGFETTSWNVNCQTLSTRGWWNLDYWLTIAHLNLWKKGRQKSEGTGKHTEMDIGWEHRNSTISNHINERRHVNYMYTWYKWTRQAVKWKGTCRHVTDTANLCLFFWLIWTEIDKFKKY